MKASVGEDMEISLGDTQVPTAFDCRGAPAVQRDSTGASTVKISNPLAAVSDPETSHDEPRLSKTPLATADRLP